MNTSQWCWQKISTECRHREGIRLRKPRMIAGKHTDKPKSFEAMIKSKRRRQR